MNKIGAFLLMCMALPFGAHAAHTPLPAAQAAYDRAVALNEEKKPTEAAAAAIEAIEADPEFLAPYDWLAEFQFHWGYEAYKNKDLKPQIDEIAKTLETKYGEWERRFPDSTGMLYGIGSYYIGKEDPRARDYLLKYLAREPDNAKAYYDLSMDADRWGDEKAALEYMHKASLLDPQNADYAFYYASSLKGDAFEKASLDVAKRFPNTRRGAQALTWMAITAPNDRKRIAYLEQLRAQFTPEWSDDGMAQLFEAYLRTDPPRALKLAQEMRGDKPSDDWDPKVTLAQSYIEVKQKMAAGKTAEAIGLLDHLKVERYSSNVAMLARLKAQVMAEAGQAQQAYDSLLQLQVKSPTDETKALLVDTGKRLKKTPAQVGADIKQGLAAGAKDAPPFDLQMYTSDDHISLSKLRGKVVFVTFWFPGCGPCRGEMPHFETVLKQVKSKDVVYLGINGVRDQDSYVVPFMAGTKYSFTPLKGTDEVTGKDAYNVRGYPSNFLIDRSGRIVYSNFMIHDAEGELMVQRMIESLL